MTHPNEQPGKTGGPDAILAVLTNKAWFEQRFGKQVKSLFPNSGATLSTQQLALLYISRQLSKIPHVHRNDTCSYTAKLLVDKADDCPYPSQLLGIMAEAVLKCLGLTFDQFYERAKDFFTLPPSTQAIADRWLERVIYTTVRRLGRERFAVISAQEWRQAVTDTMLAEDVDLVAYQVVLKPEVTVAADRNFQSLLKGRK